MIKKEPKNYTRKRRHKRVRQKIEGTAECPRLNVYRSLQHIYAQIIDDDEGNTLVSASSLDPEVKKEIARGSNQEAAQKVGEIIGKRAKDQSIERVVFDRGGYPYHGRIKALAEAVRQEGIEF